MSPGSAIVGDLMNESLLSFYRIQQGLNKGLMEPIVNAPWIWGPSSSWKKSWEGNDFIYQETEFR